jgi:hypothetical protein
MGVIISPLDGLTKGRHGNPPFFSLQIVMYHRPFLVAIQIESEPATRKTTFMYDRPVAFPWSVTAKLESSAFSVRVKNLSKTRGMYR